MLKKWFKKGKKEKKPDYADRLSDNYTPRGYAHAAAAPPLSSCPIGQLPPQIIEHIFCFVCPHSQDESYERCEQSMVEDTCMLCDLRDLCHCAQVSRRWRQLAQSVLYYSIRIDQVHYCDLEDVLAEKRKRKSFRNRNAEPEDTAAARLGLLARTLREDKGGVALRVQFLKTAYMTRETCKPDLARAAQVLPNLRYIDLPEGFFSDDASCHALKQEVQATCRDIRKMAYTAGSERSLEMLASGALWRNLEVLEITRLNIDPTILRNALGSLPRLSALKIRNMDCQDDLFQPSDFLMPFPALTELIFEDTPNITVDGISAYLFRSDAQNTLKTLSLTATGVHPASLHQIFSSAPQLLSFSFIESVSTSFPATSIPLLQSSSITTFHYEITSESTAKSFTSTTASYYGYLTNSLMSGGLPNLKELYVRDPNFPESLLDLSPPKPAFASDPDNFLPPPPGFSGAHQAHTRSQSNPFLAPSASFSSSPPTNNPNRFSSNNPFAPPSSLSPTTRQSPLSRTRGLPQTLQVYSKGLDEMEWNFSRVQPPAHGQTRGRATQMRPISSYGLNVGETGAAAGARRSVVVGNGFGGFLAVPVEEGGGDGRPRTSDGGSGKRGVVRKGSKGDLWR